jgi:hypothetical protein
LCVITQKQALNMIDGHGHGMRAPSYDRDNALEFDSGSADNVGFMRKMVNSVKKYLPRHARVSAF